jgi:hypothetical protein
LGWAAGVAAILYLVFLALLFFSQGWIIYPGARNHVEPSAPNVPGLEVLALSTPAGRVEALFLPAKANANRGPRPLMIFAHGNGEVTDYWVSSLDGFRERGIGVLLVEYPGYARSTGSPSELSIRTAMDAAYDRIVKDPRVDRTRVFGFGQSLGGGAICLLAKDRPLRALGPVLVIHGRDDRLIPWRESWRLATAAAHATFRLYECGHGCWDPERVPFWKDAEPFLIEAGLMEPGAAQGGLGAGTGAADMLPTA